MNLKSALSDALVFSKYGTTNPEWVKLPESNSWVHVDPSDKRAKSKLIRYSARGKVTIPRIFWNKMNSALQPKVVLDIGLNYGECLFGTGYSAETLCLGIEANPKVVKHNLKSKSRHQCCNQIEIVNSLVGDVEEENKTFLFNERWTGGGSIYQEKNEPGLTEISLRSTTIDKILGAAGGARNSVLFKMDIEGSEGAAMKGFESVHDFQTAVGLIEFSEQKLNLSNHNAERFFESLLERFSVYERTKDGKMYQRIASKEQFWEDSRRGGRRTKIHTDLAVVKRGVKVAGVIHEDLIDLK